MRLDHPSRRKCLTLIAGSAAAIAGITPGRSHDMLDHAWSGVAMGADARILFCGVDAARARAAADEAMAEIERLEAALSLFRDDSEIRRLNEAGALAAPSADLRRCLGFALRSAELTRGLFDPTVQSLWEAHVDWFATGATELPPEPLVRAANARVDWRRVTLRPDAVEVGKDQRLTLNGIGQGYVTDRVAELLLRRGFEHVLVDLGEQRALGPRDDGSDWRVEGASRVFPLRHGALATSEPAGCILGAGGAAHHLFDPRTGRSAGGWKRISVAHASAAVADALSTTLAIAAAPDIPRLLARFPGTRAWATDTREREAIFES